MGLPPGRQIVWCCLANVFAIVGSDNSQGNDCCEFIHNSHSVSNQCFGLCIVNLGALGWFLVGRGAEVVNQESRNVEMQLKPFGVEQPVDDGFSVSGLEWLVETRTAMQLMCVFLGKTSPVASLCLLADPLPLAAAAFQLASVASRSGWHTQHTG